MISRMKGILLGALNIAAISIYSVGLLSPLTPSVGSPSIGVLVGWVGIPLLALLLMCLISRKRYTVLWVFVQALIIIIFTTYITYIVPP